MHFIYVLRKYFKTLKISEKVDKTLDQDHRKAKIERYREVSVPAKHTVTPKSLLIYNKVL